MSCINTINELLSNIRDNKEVVLVGEGNKRRYIIVKYLQYIKQIQRICCIVEFGIKKGYKYEDVPIFSHNNISCFSKTALFIVVSDKSNTQLACSYLVPLECKKVMWLGDEVYDSMENEIKKIDKNQLYLEKIVNELRNIRNMITEQNEISDLHKNTFKCYQNYYRDKDIVIMGTGPSAKFYKPLSNVINIGLNRAWEYEGLNFDYLFTHDPSNEEKAKEIMDGLGKIKEAVFVGKFFHRHIGRDSWEEYPEVAHEKIKRYYSNQSNDGRAYIHQNICYHPLMDYMSIVFPALHFALFTHPRRIFLVGCDTTIDAGDHFYDDENEKSVFATNVMKVGFIKAKEFAEQFYPDTEIISVNPVGLKGLFSDIYTDDFPDFPKGKYVRNLILEMKVRMGISDGTRIALYGAGDQGKRIFEILRKDEGLKLCNWVDKSYDQIGFPVNSPETLRDKDKYDYILIAIEKEDVVEGIKAYLYEMGVSESKIIWFSDIPNFG